MEQKETIKGELLKNLRCKRCVDLYYDNIELWFWAKQTICKSCERQDKLEEILNEHK